MKKETSAPKEKTKPKSIILLLLALFLLLNSALLFRAGINTIFFTEDISGDYAPVQAIVHELRVETDSEGVEPARILPVFTFMYNDEEQTMEAPGLVFKPSRPLFRQGQKYTLWVHKYRGELIMPPKGSLQDMGRSQLMVSGICLLLAIGAWMLRMRQRAKS